MAMAVACIACSSPVVAAAPTDQELMGQRLFEKVFGELAVFPDEIVEEVLALPAHERLYRDTDGDGSPNEVWFVDESRRHPEEYRPVLVRAIDRDGDMDWGGFPDLDSDLYLASWRGDGIVNAVLEYTDTTGNDEVDEMAVYYMGPLQGYFDEPILRVWWTRDDGGDNLLWYDIAYTYDQGLCEYRTHFGGDETFVAFALPLSGDRWIPFWENPFLFYDIDGRGGTEEVLRFSGIGYYVDNIRHSFDANNDSHAGDPRRFDVSITAWAPGVLEDDPDTPRSMTTLSEEHTESVVIAGIPTDTFLSHERARDFARKQVWERAILTWVEMDLNYDQQRSRSTYERWEGVIAPGNDHFPQVGGPHAGHYNNRFEVVGETGEPFSLYYHPVDRRIHLRHPEHAWLIVDPDMTEDPVMRYDMHDTTGDGFIDRWELDVTMDGEPDDVWTAHPSLVPEPFDYTFEEVHGATSRFLAKTGALEDLERALTAVTRSLPAEKRPARVGVREFFLDALPGQSTAFQRQLAESELYYHYALQSSIDYLLAHLRLSSPGESFWEPLSEARSRGDLTAMADILAGHAGIRFDSLPPIEWPELDFGGMERTVAWNDTWAPPNVAWESEEAGYRIYWGQIDTFGKSRDVLVSPTLGTENYHVEQEWGMDTLLVGETAGVGGIALEVDGEYIPVRTPGGEGDITFDHELLYEEDHRLGIRVVAGNIVAEAGVYTVQMDFHAVGGQAHSPVDVTILDGPSGHEINLLVEVMALEGEQVHFDSAAGVLGNWGKQQVIIGWIGLGVTAPGVKGAAYQRLEDAHALRIPARPGESIRYYIHSDWLNGHRFSRAPSARQWFETLSASAAHHH